MQDYLILNFDIFQFHLRFFQFRNLICHFNSHNIELMPINLCTKVLEKVYQSYLALLLMLIHYMKHAFNDSRVASVKHTLEDVWVIVLSHFFLIDSSFRQMVAAQTVWKKFLIFDDQMTPHLLFQKIGYWLLFYIFFGY